MKSIYNLQNHPAAIPLPADELVEFHAARLLLLLSLCGTKGKIEGLTKLAKLDFFVRYPVFFEQVCAHLGQPMDDQATVSVESSMVRYHYGPWDKRYYQVLAYLEAKHLIQVSKIGAKTFRFALTEQGATAAIQLAAKQEFSSLTQHMTAVRKALGKKTGTALKKIIYEVFDEEIAQRKLGEVIIQ